MKFMIARPTHPLTQVVLTRLVVAILLVLNFSFPVHAQYPAAVNVRELTRALLRAKSPQERADLLAANKDLINVNLRRWLIAEGTTLLAEGKYADAHNAFSIAKTVSEQVQDTAGIGTAALNTGTVFFLQANYDSALRSYQEAHAIFAKTNDQLELARSLMGIGFVYKEQGKTAEGINYLKQAQREFEALGSIANGDELADVLNAIGSLYQSQGNFGEAIKYFEKSKSNRDDAQSTLRIADAFYAQGNYLQALAYYEKVLKRIESGPDSGPALSIATFGNLANVYYRLGDYDLSLNYYQKNLEILERLGDKSGLAVTLEGIGNVHRQQGDFGAALDNYLLSVKNADETGGRVSPATALSNIGLIRATQGNTAEAIEYYGKSLTEFERRADQVGMARALVNIGNSSYVLGDFQHALDTFQKALTLREGMDDKPGAADVLLGIGTVQSAQRNFPVALETLRRGLSIQEQLNDNEGIARILREMAKCFALQNDHAQALTLIERAVASATLAGSRDLQWRTNLDKGKYNKKLNRTVEARRAFEEAIRLIDELQTSSCTNFLDQTYPFEVIEPSAELVSLLIEEGKSQEAFATLERGKSQAFRSIFRKDELRINKPLTAAEKEEERRSFSSLLALEIELARARVRRVPDEKTISAIKTRLSQAQAACVNSRKTMYARYPQLAIHRGELPQLRGVVDAASFVTDLNTALIEFLVTDSTTYLFVLTRNPKSRTRSLQLQAYPIQIPRSELTALIGDFRKTVTTWDVDIVEGARRLYELLLRPAEEQLRNKSNIIIAPDRELWAMPFQVLMTNQNRYLIEQAAISYVPSMTMGSVINKALRRRTPLAPTSIMFVNPTINDAIARRIELTSGSATVIAVPAPKTITRNVTLSGAHASEAAARVEFSNHGTINLATTTVIDDASPLASYVVLTGATEPKTDGLLHAWETMQINSSAQIAFIPFSLLARKQVDSGIGITAMTWSWYVAGTPTTIISQWPADPDRTLELLERFRVLTTSRRLSKAAALQTAIRSYLEANPNYNHPYYWSGLRLLGNPK